MIGAGGDRDPGKRPLMGEIAGRLADVLVVTDDNPRTEDPAAIRAAILAGTRTPPPRWSRSATARRAIREALDRAGPGDIVLVAGKGHETGQEVAGDGPPVRRPRGRPRGAPPMIPMTLGELAAACAARLVAGEGATVVDGPVTTDSRECRPGSLYVARRGEHADGHDFAPAAVEAGAVAVLGERPVPGVPTLVVDDVQTAFGRVARASSTGRRTSPCWP